MSPKCFERQQPHWGPENQVWRPGGPPFSRDWHGQRARFFRRIGGLIALLFLVACAGFSLLSWLVADFIGVVDISPGSLALVVPVAGLALVFMIFGAFRIGFLLSRTVVPMGDLIEAANRVADGDYSARVMERGPKEVSSLARTFNMMAERLQTNNEIRRRLLADVTHELRTPLTVIQGNVEGLIDGVYPADETHLRAILEETQVMARLIQDLRTLSQVESGSLQLQIEPIQIEDLLQGVKAAFQTQADSAKVLLSLEIDAGLPEVLADYERIRALVENLLANALRYTPPGGSIRMKAYPEGDRVAVAVCDTGRGISPEDLPHIFDRFYKSSDSGGMGLGLAIARGIIEAHGGEITAKSEPGKGTTIQFTLPFENQD